MISRVKTEILITCDSYCKEKIFSGGEESVLKLDFGYIDRHDLFEQCVYRASDQGWYFKGGFICPECMEKEVGLREI